MNASIASGLVTSGLVISPATLDMLKAAGVVILLVAFLRGNILVNGILLVGAVIAMIGASRQTAAPAPPRVEYRFVPRTFREEQEAPVKVSHLFAPMFTQPNPWPVGGFTVPGYVSETNFVGGRIS